MLDDAQVLNVIEKMIKQRRDSITQFRAAAREDLATREEFEVGVIQELHAGAARRGRDRRDHHAKAITDSGAASAKDMGKVIGLVRPQIAGRADMGAVSQRVKARLGVQSGRRFNASNRAPITPAHLRTAHAAANVALSSSSISGLRSMSFGQLG